jgi:hypothetical protein
MLPPNTAGPVPPMGAMPMSPPAMTGTPQQLGINTAGVSVGGIMQIRGATEMVEQARREAEAQQNQPVILNLASHVRTCWHTARQAKEMTVEPRMFKAIRQRRGEYDPEVLAQIRQQGGSEIYMMLTSAKCRGAGSWLRDVMMAQGSEKPWNLKPTPIPNLPPEMVAQLRQHATQELAMYMATSGGQPPNDLMLRQFLQDLRDEYMNNMYQQARFGIEQMEKKMEDQLIEGGFPKALNDFVDDITTFPAAIMKGPVVRRRPKMQWKPNLQGTAELVVEDTLVLEWERVDPFMVYPSPNSTDVDDGYFIERHRMRQVDLEALIGVEGYDEAAIKKVLDEYARGGLIEWLSVDSSKATVEGRHTTGQLNPEANIDGLQFWGNVPGKLLLEWGLTPEEVPEPHKQYPCEVWLIGSTVIKASLNYHPLGKKPYYKASYEELPGMFWGNAVTDLVRDCQDVCNSTARAMQNNLGISSGPQVSVLSDRLPPGEDITQMYPWKIWQFNSDPMNSSTANKPIEFFQPVSNTMELMQVYEKFSVLADEYSNIPRYMTGDAPAGGAGRTASGMNMLMNNASRSMKQVVSNIDHNVLTPLLERLFFHNMKYGEDPALQRTDAQIVARGAASVIAKEQAQIRRNEFLATTANPFDMAILGPEGRRELLRERVKDLDMDADKVIPPQSKLTLAAKMAAVMPQPGAPGEEQAAGGTPKSGEPDNKQTLSNGAAIKDDFSPTKQK